MASYPMRDGVHDFDADKCNEMMVKHSFPSSGMSAGVQSGLSAVEPTGGIQAQQKSAGSTFRPELREESGGSKNGKSFTFR